MDYSLKMRLTDGFNINFRFQVMAIAHTRGECPTFFYLFTEDDFL